MDMGIGGTDGSRGHGSESVHEPVDGSRVLVRVVRVFESGVTADDGGMRVIAFGDRGGYWRSMKLFVAASWCFRADGCW